MSLLLIQNTFCDGNEYLEPHSLCSPQDRCPGTYLSRSYHPHHQVWGLQIGRQQGYWYNTYVDWPVCLAAQDTLANLSCLGVRPRLCWAESLWCMLRHYERLSLGVQWCVSWSRIAPGDFYILNSGHVCCFPTTFKSTIFCWLIQLCGSPCLTSLSVTLHLFL